MKEIRHTALYPSTWIYHGSDLWIPGTALEQISTVLILTQLQQTAFENIVGKGEVACNEQFLLSHNVFY